MRVAWNGNGFGGSRLFSEAASAGSGLLPVTLGLMGVNALLDTAQTAVSANSARKQNSLNAESIEYNKWLNQEMWNREDTAVQRRAADLEAAGFNPLLAVDSAASSGAGGFLSAPDVQSPTIRNSALEQLSSLLETQQHERAQKELNVALRQADDEHNMAIKQQELADQQYNSLVLQNQNQRAENQYQISLLEQKLSEGNQSILKLGQEIELLKKQTQTEGTKVELNKAETALKEAQAEQQRQETAVYSTYEPQERAIKLKTLTQEYEEFLSQRSRNSLSFQQEMEIQAIEREIKSCALAIQQHDLPLLTDSALPSSVVEAGAKSLVGKATQDSILAGELGRNQMNTFLKEYGVDMGDSMFSILWRIITGGKQ